MLEIRPYDAAQDFPSVLSLYESVNWVTYTSETDRLQRALENSYVVFVAVSDGEIVGLVRTISDGEVICYIQDLLVTPAHQRTGVGMALVRKVFETCDLRQTVLMTDSQHSQRSFYEAAGFSLIEGDLSSFVRLK
jgi:GNAT superfamily N-acetyltransferase